jgi:hypothetical protein
LGGFPGLLWADGAGEDPVADGDGPGEPGLAEADALALADALGDALGDGAIPLLMVSRTFVPA